MTGKLITIDVLRHGEPGGGDILRGRVNPELTARGWQQMHEAAQRADADWHEVISSPLRRCRDFAEHLAQGRRLPLRIEESWQELDYGDWDGLPMDEWRKRSASQFRSFRENITALAPPNGENFIEFRDRVLGAWQGLAELPENSHVLLVTHGGVMRVILPTVLGIALNRSLPLNIPFACLTRVLREVDTGRERASVLFHNAGLGSQSRASEAASQRQEAESDATTTAGP